MLKSLIPYEYLPHCGIVNAQTGAVIEQNAKDMINDDTF